MSDHTEAVLAIDIGGTKIAFAEVDGGSVNNRWQIPTPRAGGGDALVHAIASEIRGSQLTQIGIATTGIVSEGALTALNPATLPIEDRYPLAAKLASATGCIPLIINDAQAAAWGEYNFGAGQGTGNFLFVTVSTGVGAGLVLGGRLQIGATGLAGHLGHAILLDQDTVCGCGRRGCLETIASGTSISRRFSKMAGRTVGAPAVFAAAQSGNPEANKTLDDAAAALAQAFANVVALADVDCIAVGGGVGLAPGFLERIHSCIAQSPSSFRRPVIAAQAGADAGLIGVATLVRRKTLCWNDL